jgi:hypothetical protein
MSITAIACQAQGIRAGEVIDKLAEDAYFMRVDNRVTQPPPARNRDNKATSCSVDLGRNRTRAELPAQPSRTRANAGGPSQAGNNAVAVKPRIFIEKSESLYHRDSPWISGYRVQNVSQINTQSHTSHHIKIIVHKFITSPLWSTSLQASLLNQSENSTQR